MCRRLDENNETRRDETRRDEGRRDEEREGEGRHSPEKEKSSTGQTLMQEEKGKACAGDYCKLPFKGVCV